MGMRWLREDDRWMLVCIIVFSFLMHLLYVAETTIPEFTTPVIDSYEYHTQAVRILAHDIPSTPFWRPPLYPYWLALVYRFTGPDPALARYVDVIWMVLACMLTFAIARRVAPVRLAFVSALLIPLCGPLVFQFGQLMPTGMAVSLDLAALLMLFRLAEKPTAWRGLGFGVLLGIAALATPNILSLLLVALVWLAHEGIARRAWQRTVAMGLCILAGVVLSIAPVTLRNAVVSGQWVPISTNGGINFYIGNNSDYRRTMAIRPGPDWDRLISMPEDREACRTAAGRERFFLRQVLSSARHEPTNFLKGMAVKTFYFLHSREIPRNLDAYALRKHSETLTVLLWKWGSFGFPFGVIFPLAVAGMVLGLRAERDRLLLAGYVAAYSASVILFFPASRYRIPIIPALLVFAVIGTRELFLLARERQRRFAFGMILVVATATLISLPVSFPTDATDFESELRTDIGVNLLNRGRPVKAAEELLRAIRLNRNNDAAHYNLGRVMKDMGETKKAMASYRQALAIRPEFPAALVALGETLCEIGRLTEAEDCFRRALAIRSDDPSAWNDLGLVALQKGRFDEAVDCFCKAMETGGPNPLTMINMGDALLSLGKAEKAARYFRKAIELDPENPDAYRNLGVALTQAGEKEEAARAFRRGEEQRRKSEESKKSIRTE